MQTTQEEADKVAKSSGTILDPLLPIMAGFLVLGISYVF